MNNIRIAENFHLHEFQCKDGSHQVVLHSELLRRLQQMRSALGRPLIINSGYRNAEHNTRVGGSPGSYHLRGMAADIVVRGLPLAELAAAARKAGFRGIGTYSSFVHVDIRDQRTEWKG